MAMTFSMLSDLSQGAKLFDSSHELVPPPRKRLSYVDGMLSATLRLKSAYTSLHPALPDTPVWAYDGLVPGPTVVVDSGEHVHIRIKNRITTRLPYRHVVVDKQGGMNEPGADPSETSSNLSDQQ